MMMMMKRWRALVVSNHFPYRAPRASRLSRRKRILSVIWVRIRWTGVSNSQLGRWWTLWSSLSRTLKPPPHIRRRDATGQSHPAASMPCAPLRPRRPAAGRRRRARRSQLRPPSTGEKNKKKDFVGPKSLSLNFVFSPTSLLMRSEKGFSQIYRANI